MKRLQCVTWEPLPGAHAQGARGALSGEIGFVVYRGRKFWSELNGPFETGAGAQLR